MGVAFATILRPLAAVKHKYKKKTSAFWHNTKDSFPTLFRNTLLSTHAHTHTRKNMHGTLHVDFLLN